MSSCNQSDYTKLVKSELAKGVRQDSILLGMHFRDTRNEFYGKCFDLNKQQVVSQGDNFSVQYLFTDSVFHSEPVQIKLLFVPAFDDQEKITNMDMKFSYLNWSPMNPQLQADSLKPEVMKILMNWYKGNDFIKAKVDDEIIPVKLDGNRRMLVFVYDNRDVVVKVQDILHPKFKHSISVAEQK